MENDQKKQKLIEAAKEIAAEEGVMPSDELWDRAYATNQAFRNDVDEEKFILMLKLNAVSTAEVEIANKSNQGSPQDPPPVADESASAIGRNEKARKKYENDILPDVYLYGAFVHEALFLRFILALKETPSPLDISAEELIVEDVAVWCPNEKKEGGVRENALSGQLTRLCQRELVRTGNMVEILHQCSVLPLSKNSPSQNCDISIFKNSKIAVCIEVKAAVDVSPGDECQACVYGTDAMVITKLPAIVILAYGTSLENMTFRVIGIVCLPGPHEGTRHRKTFLYEGQGKEGIACLMGCLKVCLGYSGMKSGAWLSSVTARHEANANANGKFRVFKAYDYRDQQEDMSTRRLSHIDLVRQHIDPEATLFKYGKDLEVLEMTYHCRSDGKQHFGPVAAKMFAPILKSLQELHEGGMVHCDVRLRNTVPYAGILIDFDHARKEKECYPPNLKPISQDGRRANDVLVAIKNGEIGSLPAMKSHDMESMLAVLELYKPVAGSTDEFTKSWNEVISTPADDLFTTVQKLEKMEGVIRLEDGFSRNLLKATTTGKDADVEMPGAGTGSPEKQKVIQEMKKKSDSSTIMEENEVG